MCTTAEALVKTEAASFVHTRRSLTGSKIRPAITSRDDAAASTASRPNVRDDGQRPSSGQDDRDKEVIWVKREQEYFCKRDWTGQITLKGLGKLVSSCTG